MKTSAQLFREWSVRNCGLENDFKPWCFRLDDHKEIVEAFCKKAEVTFLYMEPLITKVTFLDNSIIYFNYKGLEVKPDVI